MNQLDIPVRVSRSGAKGPRYDDWAWLHIGTGSHRHPLVRRNRSTGELAFYLGRSPTEVPLSALVRVAGVRWSVEECFQAANTLAMLALAFLTALAATTRLPNGPPGTPPCQQPRSDRADRPGRPPPAHRRPRPTGRDSGQAAALVQLAQTPSGNGPMQPLPTTNRWIAHEPHWSTSPYPRPVTATPSTAVPSLPVMGPA
ncbi:hypothetical protein GCM10023323_22330 [Streptomyces thinghirensis]|uniref:Transposase IS701-like DDE domain-containing protein n=1 Tax=Streptomyces thinghirensis TaxID=551547 RepID=A0ABP9SZF7_9ACTN